MNHVVLWQVLGSFHDYLNISNCPRVMIITTSFFVSSGNRLETTGQRPTVLFYNSVLWNEHDYTILYRSSYQIELESDQERLATLLEQVLSYIKVAKYSKSPLY